MTFRTLAVVVGVVMSCAWFAAPALADGESVRDARDFGGDVDIKRAAHGHGRNQQTLQHRLRTHDSWKSRRLRYRGKRVDFFFDIDADRAIDRHVTVRYRDGRLRATMYEGKQGSRFLADVKVWRRDQRGLSVSFPRSLFGSGLGSYRWEAQSRFKSCPDFSDMAIKPCYDFAPEHGRVTHRL